MHLATAGIPIEVQLGPDEWGGAIRRDVAAGLVANPPEPSPAWLCDERGRELFEATTRLPEYYPTHAERGGLTDGAGEIAASADLEIPVELGARTSETTRHLLNAMSGPTLGPGRLEVQCLRGERAASRRPRRTRRLCQVARGRRLRPLGRRTYRNSFPAQARWAFAGVRLANPTEA